ncbi:hypothetical protein Tco_1467848 [Tanacetum coccineum]
MENSYKVEVFPMMDKLRLSQSHGRLLTLLELKDASVPYAPAVGSIMYAVRCTRPNVAFAQNINKRLSTNPGDIKRELGVSCYTDVGYLTDADDLKSQTGYVFVFEWRKRRPREGSRSCLGSMYVGDKEKVVWDKVLKWCDKT